MADNENIDSPQDYLKSLGFEEGQKVYSYKGQSFYAETPAKAARKIKSIGSQKQSSKQASNEDQDYLKGLGFKEGQKVYNYEGQSFYAETPAKAARKIKSIEAQKQEAATPSDNNEMSFVDKATKYVTEKFAPIVMAGAETVADMQKNPLGPAGEMASQMWNDSQEAKENKQKTPTEAEQAAVQAAQTAQANIAKFQQPQMAQPATMPIYNPQMVSTKPQEQLLDEFQQVQQQQGQELEGVQEQFKQAGQLQEDAAQKQYQADIEAVNAQQEYNKRIAEQQNKFLEEQEIEKKAHEMAQQDLRAKQELAQTMFDEFPYGDPNEIKQAQDTLSDPNASKFDQARANRKLERARTKEGARKTNKVGYKLAASLAIALGGIGEALGGQKSDALNMILGAIDRDIAEQEAKADQQRGKIADIQNAITVGEKVYGDRDKAKYFAFKQAADFAQNKLQQEMAQAKTQEAQARLSQTMAGIQDALAQKEQQLIQQTANNVNKAILTKRALQGDITSVQQGNQAAANKVMMLGGGQPDETKVLEGYKIKEGYKPTKDDIKKVKTYASAQAELDSLMEKMIKLREKVSIAEKAKDVVGASKIISELEGLGGLAFNALRKKTGAGAALTPIEERMMDPNGWLRNPGGLGFGAMQLKTLQAANKQGADKYYSSMGFEKATKGTKR